MASTLSETNVEEESNSNPAPANGTTPTIPDWVNEDYFVDVIEENVDGFKKILEFEPSLTGGAGENYASIMIRVKVKVELEDGSTKDVSYMIKTLPQSEQASMMINMMGLFPKESAIYGKYLPEFEQMYRDVGKQVTFGPKFYKLKKDPGVPYVLLEDISPFGFKNLNRLQGLDKEHTESVLRILAELHAVSAVRFETKGEFEPLLMKPMFDENSRELLNTMRKSLELIYAECLAKYKTGVKFADKIKKLQNRMTDLYIKHATADPSEINVLNHGDLWANNIMFRHNDEGKRKETILVDFQVSRYATPAVDLYYFLISSTNLDLKVSHFDYFIKYYYDHLVENLNLLNYPKEVPSLKKLHMELLNHSFLAYATAGGIMAAVLLDPNENANFDNFVQEGEAGQQFKRQLYSNPRYVKHMEVILPWMDVRGLFD